MIKVTIGQDTYQYEDGTTLYEIAREHQSEYKHQIILAKCNGTLSELSKVLVENCNIAFVTTASFVGNEWVLPHSKPKFFENEWVRPHSK